MRPTEPDRQYFRAMNVDSEATGGAPVAGPDQGPPGGGADEAGKVYGSRSFRWVVELVGVVVVAVVIAVLLRTFVVATYSIPSGSMEPTLQIGDRIVVDKLSYHLHGVETGNIIVFATPPAEDCAGPPVANLVKRVIGLPGETISLSEGQVYIDGTLLAEPWLPPSVRNETYPGPSGAALLAAPGLPHPRGGRLRHG